MLSRAGNPYQGFGPSGGSWFVDIGASVVYGVVDHRAVVSTTWTASVTADAGQPAHAATGLVKESIAWW